MNDSTKKINEPEIVSATAGQSNDHKEKKSLVLRLLTKKEEGRRPDAMALLSVLEDLPREAGTRRVKTALQETGRGEDVLEKKAAAGDSRVLNFNTKLSRCAE
ncbi:MAG: hypothetical protein HZC03_01190 [Candidatus Lloydbacteria bacterium]|nr:hypothetical protein [Candidatus Lloydbacteria bacterium]